MTLQCIAIDDEPLALKKIEGYCARISTINLAATFTNPIDSIAFLQQNTIHLIFLDIQMDGLTGIELLETLNTTPKIIITTAFDQYALQSYEFDVADYLLKPYSFARFLAAVNKSQAQIIGSILPLRTETHSDFLESDFFFVKEGNQIRKINLADILYVEGMKEYLGIYTPFGRVVTMSSFKRIEEMLPASLFVRVHRSFLIALRKIDRIESHSVFIGLKEIPLGDTYKSAFIGKIKQYLR